MSRDISIWKINLKWNLFILIIALGIGTYIGYKLLKKTYKHGCYQLKNDVLPINLKPYSSEHTQFIAVGDVGTGNDDQLEVSNAMAKVCEKSGCDLVLLLGDNFYPSGVNSPTDPQFESKFEMVYQKLKIPFFVVLGNHDVKQDALSQVMYSLKSDYWKMPNFQYDFMTMNATFYGVNTNCPLGFEMLRRDINQEKIVYKSNKKNVPWKIVFGHHSVYSNGTHGDSNILVRSFWSWFLEDKIDLYLAGHNHNLAHFKIDNSNIDYVISGAGGANYRSTDERRNLTESEANNLFTFNDIGFVWFDITFKKLLMRFYDSNGNVLYEYTKTK